MGTKFDVTDHDCQLLISVVCLVNSVMRVHKLIAKIITIN